MRPFGFYICSVLIIAAIACAEKEDKKPSESPEGIPGYLRGEGLNSIGKIITDHGAKIVADPYTVVISDGEEKHVVFWVVDANFSIPTGAKSAMPVDGAIYIDSTLPKSDGSFSKDVIFDNVDRGNFFLIIGLGDTETPKELVLNTTKDGFSDYVAFELELIP